MHKKLDQRSKIKTKSNDHMKILRILLIIVIICGLSTCFTVGYYYFLYAPYLQIKHVKITGCNKLTPLEILEGAKINTPTNTLLVPTDAINERLRKYPWVDEIRLKRLFPDKLEIKISERRPVAIVYLDAPYYIDRGGTIFKKIAHNDSTGYPIITGIDRCRYSKDEGILLSHALDLIEWIVDSDREDPIQVSEVHVDRDLGLTLYTLDTRIQVEMGVDGFREKYAYLRRLLTFMQKNGGCGNITWINLNCGERIFVRKTPDKINR